MKSNLYVIHSLKSIIFRLLTCGSLRFSDKQAGGPGGEGHSKDTYDPELSHSVRYDDGVVACVCDCWGGVFVG